MYFPCGCTDSAASVSTPVVSTQPGLPICTVIISADLLAGFAVLSGVFQSQRASVRRAPPGQSAAASWTAPGWRLFVAAGFPEGEMVPPVYTASE